jgi:hypothetical protein
LHFKVIQVARAARFLEFDDMIAWPESAPMVKRYILAICLVGVLAGGYLASYGIRTTRTETLRRLVAENVKIGATSDDVLRFLDEQHLDHSALTRTSKSSERMTYGDVPMIGAIKRRTWRSLLMFGSIQIVFIFDENNHLVRFDLYPVYTGL